MKVNGTGFPLAPRQLVNGLLALWLLAAAWIAVAQWPGDADGAVLTGGPVEAAASQPLYWQWFSGPAVSSPEAAEGDELREARIDAEVIGIAMSGGMASATIRVRGQDEQVYRSGEELQSGVVLIAVGPTRVILDERGQRVQLSLNRSEVAVQSASSAPAQAAGLPEAGVSLANMFSAVPVQVDGGGTGFRLDSLSEDLQTQTDLQEGDVIIRIGDDSIQDILGEPSRWMGYSAQTNLPVTILRDGAESVVYVNASSLSATLLPSLTEQLMP